MNALPALLLLAATSLLEFSLPAHATPLQTPATWTSVHAEHLYGLPDIKPHKKGVLTITPDTLTFTAKSGNINIPRTSIYAVSAGNQRMELWGTSGRILRMVIPDGGGLAAAALMHHRVDMLTLDFTGAHGGRHSAVFFLPANEATAALQSFTPATLPPPPPAPLPCSGGLPEPKTLFVASPTWDNATVPEAYQALVYEHIVDRLRKSKSVAHVYRAGELTPAGLCPQYTVHIAIAAFKEGSSVKRAALGPLGFFVGTTQMTFDATLTDTSGKLLLNKQIKATIRGESESTDVADHIAKSLTKQYDSTLKQLATPSGA